MPRYLPLPQALHYAAMQLAAFRRRAPVALLAASLGLWVAGCAAPAPPPPASVPPAAIATPAGPAVELLGTAELPTGFRFGDTEVGGLSALVYDAGRGVYLALSDDRSQTDPARFYTLTIDLGDGRLADGDVVFTGVTVLTHDGATFAAGSLDPEGLAPAAGGELYVSSEGGADAGIPPFVRRFRADGSEAGELPLPAQLMPAPAAPGQGAFGVRDNLALESLAASPDGRWLFTASESALAQDGPVADVGVAAAARLVVFDLATGTAVRQLVYPLDALTVAPAAPDGLRVGGLVELAAVDAGRLLALERQFALGTGFAVRLYTVSLDGADDVSALPSLASSPAAVPAPRPVSKRLLADLGALLAERGVALDNLEGMAFGPPLADGRRTLVLVADNNFNPIGQRTLFVALALDLTVVRGAGG